MTDLHLTNTMPEFFAKWQKEGVKGIRVHDLQLETNTVEDWVSEGRTAEEWNARHRRYCMFLLYPDFESEMFGSSSSELINVEPDFHGFRTEIERQLRERFGEELVCRWSFDGNELEIGFPDTLPPEESDEDEAPKVGEILNEFFKKSDSATSTLEEEVLVLRHGITLLAGRMDPREVEASLKEALSFFEEHFG